MHERGIRSIQHVAVRNIVTTATRSGPPDDFSGTGRISYVIFSTVLLYIVAGAIIAVVVSFPRRYPQTVRTVKRAFLVSYKRITAVPAVMVHHVQTQLRLSQGFQLARSDEEVDKSSSSSTSSSDVTNAVNIGSTRKEIQLSPILSSSSSSSSSSSTNIQMTNNIIVASNNISDLDDNDTASKR